MSRSGYSDDLDQQELMLWRGAVASAIRGKRGQAFLREMLVSLDALPEKKLIVGELQDEHGAVCALGSVGKSRGMDMSHLSYDDNRVALGKAFGIAGALVAEIEFINDDDFYWAGYCYTDERRFGMVRKWVVENINEEVNASD